MNPHTLQQVILFFRPLQPTGSSLRARLQQLALGLVTALSLLFLSGIGLAAFAAFTVCAFLMLLIFEYVLGVDFRLPSFATFASRWA